jgi:hypothetical protein
VGENRGLTTGRMLPSIDRFTNKITAEENPDGR